MKLERLDEILAAIPGTRIAVVGDFFLDQYWAVEQELAERSIETGLTAHQVVEVRVSPGAAGTVANNLSALGVGHIVGLGLLGDDGSGHELRRALVDRGVVTDRMIMCPDRYTPVYTKPMLRTPSGEREMERFDIKNRTPTPSKYESELIRRLRGLPEDVEAVMIMDQIEKPDVGAITSAVRTEMIQLARSKRQCLFLADSRCRIGMYDGMILKPNRREAARALGMEGQKEGKLALQLARRNRSRILMTLGAQGLLFSDGKENWYCPAFPVEGPIDIVGAGDSVSAAFVSSVCAGAETKEAMQVAALVASVTIQKLGTTGTANPDEIRGAASRHRHLLEDLG